MDKEVLNAYAARVAQANRSELVIIMYEAILDSVEEGRKCLEADEIEVCRREIGRARGLLTELMGGLGLSCDQDHSQAVMQNAQPIYAGLTYGRTSLNENIGVDVSVNRGFQA